MIEAQLLSKIIENNDFSILNRYNVGLVDFPTLGEVYLFVRDYVKDNGQTPDYRTVAAACPDFDFQPEIRDEYKYLCSRLKATTAKRQAFELLQHKAAKKFSELPGDKFVAWLKEETQRIEATTMIRINQGTNFATNGEDRAMWYAEAKLNRTRQYIPTPYPSLTDALGGGFEIGDYILLLAFTNRGKSWIASHVGLIAWENEFTVLHYSPELSKRQQALRLDTLKGHYDNTKLRRGILDNEVSYLKYLQDYNPTSNKVPYIIKTMEDLPTGLSLEVIETDIQANPNVKLVIIDGFNLMIHGKGRMRDSMTQTSRQLRQIFGRHKVAGMVVHQTPGKSEKDNKEIAENGARLVKPPKLTDYSETVAVIQDAATALTFDACDGIGRISIEKAREPNVGKVIELRCDFNRGFIQEPDLAALF
ncbi:hypothetical protein Dtox_1866 [Desulfofarcimen acetoxidans DSM 771]|uniref:SF4 helicase domain-containing protein n=1 Tax=Desulfofarcimen acetoxidans (strain ATCC 49208 / DSM 771 / KCTC 5769 / VKM B-1644 / 5575) TaxID=485916 RepID=C8VXQ6_DESAS|nr:DnaB-like helicase C-terminal domain-containing protein [Desulfofarcimen acetoxidans]ACV62712.1 hypothetical protein Dtox_1866 [Desulfofarcimen acetoxidans DSM 771]